METLETRKLLSVDPVLVKDIVSGSLRSSPSNLTNVNGTLFFSADDGVNGYELWQSDGTSAGTTLVKDIVSGSSSSYPSSLTNVNGTLFFSANDGVNGTELWSMPVNSRPQLTTFAAVVDATAEDTEVELTFAELLAQSDATDLDGTVDAFIVQAVSSGTLKIGTSLGTATAFAVGSNDKIDATLNAYWTPDANISGNAITALTVLAQDNIGDNSNLPVAAAVDVTTVADTPSVTNASTLANVQTTSGLVISRNVADGAEVTHFKITSITGGTLFQSDGTTAITDNDFITFAEANGGLKFTPAVDSTATGRFTVQASLSNLDAGLGGSTVTADITVTLAKPAVTAPNGTTTSQRPTVTWSPIAGAASYEIWISDLSTNTSPVVLATPETASYVPTVDLGIGKFRAWVRAKSSGGAFSAWSTGHDFQITTAAVLDTLSTPQTTVRPTFSWPALPGADHYDIWIGNVSGNPSQPIRDTNVASTSFTVPSDLPIGKFRAWVRGIAADGFAASWSSLVSFSVSVAPTVTQGQNATFASVPTITWDALPGAEHYDIWINGLSTGTIQFVRNMNLATTTFTDSSAWPIGNYRAWVRGIAADGYAAAWTTRIDFTINGAPTVTQGLNSTFDRTPTFGWNALAGAASYEVFLRNLNSGVTTLYERNIAATDFTPPSNLTDGQYRWWVRGKTATGFFSLSSQWTSPIDIYVGGNTSLLTPSGSTSNTTPTFSWKPVDGAATYDLWVNQVGGQAQIIRQSALTTTSFTPTTVLAAGTYRTWIRAISSSSEFSAWSTYVEFTIAESNGGIDGTTALPDALAGIDLSLPEFETPANANVEHPEQTHIVQPDYQPTPLVSAPRQVAMSEFSTPIEPQQGSVETVGIRVVALENPMTANDELDAIDSAMSWWMHREQGVS